MKRKYTNSKQKEAYSMSPSVSYKYKHYIKHDTFCCRYMMIAIVTHDVRLIILAALGIWFRFRHMVLFL